MTIGVNRSRLAATFAEMSMIGATKNGGVHRLALDDRDREARDLLAKWCVSSGYSLKVDRVGSMFARREGKRDVDPIVIGSHLDSQHMAGRFDGPAGVLAALEVLRTLDDHDISTDRPLVLVNWSNEEGARFAPPMLASGVFSGNYDTSFALSRSDRNGLKYGAELKRIGYAGDCDPGFAIAGYLELHIEQGTVLQDAETTIGVVSGFTGIRGLLVRVEGEDVHAGPLSMNRRRDSLVGAARMIVAANEIGLERAPEARVTVGRISVPSDSHCVVPGLTEMTVDIRHPTQEGVELLQQVLMTKFREIAADADLSVTVELGWDYPVIATSAEVQKAIIAGAQAFGYKSMYLPSRAGHDAWNMARIAPTGMIFIPCLDGISHNEREFATDEDLAAGADVLLHAALALTTIHA